MHLLSGAGFSRSGSGLQREQPAGAWGVVVASGAQIGLHHDIARITITIILPLLHVMARPRWEARGVDVRRVASESRRPDALQV